MKKRKMLFLAIVMVLEFATNAKGATPLAIGQRYQGGIIFWLDDTGQHGLIAASQDLHSRYSEAWGSNDVVTNANRNGIYAGMYNTERIIVRNGSGSNAAQLCSVYTEGGYGDWYLPSIYELKLLYYQKTIVGGFDSYKLYCSSNEQDIKYAYYFKFSDGSIEDYTTKSLGGCVRAIRAF